jgi:hypothetical protein
VKGRLLGGSSACIPIIDIQSRDHASDQALLPLSSDEDWYPLYINLASKFQEQSVECPYARELIDRNTFQDLPTSHWKYELESMGINFKPQARPIDQLLPSASKLWTIYRDGCPSNMDIAYLTLEESLSHLRIVYQRLQQLSRQLKKVQKQLDTWYKKKCTKTPHTKTDNIQRLLLVQQKLRSSHIQFNDLHQKLQKKSKARVKETKAGLQHQVFLTRDLPSIPMYNRFSILDEPESTSPVKTWYDFLPKLERVDDSSIQVFSKTSTSGISSKDESPMDTLVQTRQELVSIAPTIVAQAANMTYNIQGRFKSKEAEDAATLLVSTWNINCLTRHKARFVAQVMKQDKCDILILVDTRHSSSTSRSFKKIFVTSL